MTTSTPTAITLIGFGEVGQCLADDLLKASPERLDLVAYDIAFADASSAQSVAASQRPAVRVAASAVDAVATAQLVICAVTAEADIEAARAVSPGLLAGSYYLDLNSAAPESKRQAATVIDTAGAYYVEAAVMAPIAPKRIASAMLLGGARAAELQPLLASVGFSGGRVFSPIVGKASATKMCRSVMIKGIEALLTESMLAARHYGVEQDVLESLSDLLPVGDWPKLAHYMISRSVEHGVRRAEEMREVVATVEDAGVSAWMSAACVERQDWAPQHMAALSEPDLAAMLDAMADLTTNTQPGRTA